MTTPVASSVGASELLASNRAPPTTNTNTRIWLGRKHVPAGGPPMAGRVKRLKVAEYKSLNTKINMCLHWNPCFLAIGEQKYVVVGKKPPSCRSASWKESSGGPRRLGFFQCVVAEWYCLRTCRVAALAICYCYLACASELVGWLSYNWNLRVQEALRYRHMRRGC